ncbi:hypothetical protein QLQ12_42790 [Actinoplanes sp. NEAU-A12]|uniref:Uncharacterized protein n=1 Tax=Actinoplanes sandaracinus TaxID=3045177 RepID=A0ABT6WZZ8_9ACTN|nr:hypothetical protein [Actinoplanes sandaracinus]MDI6105330.1 hypothetical protein [Actinoplanes sandaracinus]
MAKNATVYDWTSPEGHRLSIAVEPARVSWRTWVAGRGAVNPAEPEFTEQTTVRSLELIDGRYVLNAGPDRQGDRDWTWAGEQIAHGVVPGTEHVFEPPGKRTSNAANNTSKWSWIFMDVYDLAPGGVAWAPFESESPFYGRARHIAAEARAWLDAARPEWRDESRRLGLEADLVSQREGVSRAQATIRELRAAVAESRRRMTVLRAMRSNA